MATELAPRATEAQQARFHILKTIARDNKDDALEWIKAVREVQETALWMYWHPTWDDFCRKVLGMSAAEIRQELHSGVAGAGQQPKLPSPGKSNETDRNTHCERLAKRFQSFVSGYVKVTNAWPEDDLSQAYLQELDEQLWNFAEKYEQWFADHAVTGCPSEKLAQRMDAWSKRKRKRK